MRTFVESLKRLYSEQHLIKEAKIIELYNNNKISLEEKEYILG